MAGRNDEEVRILVTAKDEASKTLANVGDSMGGLAKKAGGMGSALTTAIGTFAGGAALNLAASAFSGLTSIVTDGIAGAYEAAAGYAQLEAVLTSTGGAAGLTADELAGLSGDLSQAAGMSTFSDDAVLALENLLLTFTNVKGDIFKQATAIGVDMATALGTEPAAAAVQLGKALNDPIKGIAALSRVGVTFTKEQKDQIKVMQEAGDMAGAQAVILAELNKEFGGSAKAAAKAAGPWAQLTEQFGEFTEEIGTALLPLITRVGSALLRGPLMNALKGIIPLIGFVVDSFITLGQALTGNWEDAAEGILPFHRLIGQVGLALRGIFQGFETGGIEGAIGVLLLKLEQAVPLIIETLGTWAGAFLDWIGPMIPPFLVRLGGILAQVLTWIGEQVPAISEKLLEWGIAFSQWIGERIPIILEEIGKLLTTLLNWMRDHQAEIDATLEEWADLFGAWVMDEAWPYLLEELGKMLGEFTVWIGNQVADLTIAAIAWGVGIDEGILKGVKDNWWQIVAFIGSQLRKIPGFDLLMGTSASGTGGGSGPFAAPMGLAAAGAGVVSGVTVPSVQMVPRRRVEDVPHRGVIVAPPVVINVDARGSRDPVEVERAGYRGARRALEEAARERVGRRSVQRLRTALDRRARIR